MDLGTSIVSGAFGILAAPEKDCLNLVLGPTAREKIEHELHRQAGTSYDWLAYQDCGIDGDSMLPSHASPSLDPKPSRAE